MKVVGPQTNGKGEPLRPNLTNRVDGLEVEAQAVFQASSIFVAALVRERREEAGAQIAMSEMQFEPFEACLMRTLSRTSIIPVKLPDLGARQRMHRVGVFSAIRDGRRAGYLPPVRVIGG